MPCKITAKFWDKQHAPGVPCGTVSTYGVQIAKEDRHVTCSKCLVAINRFNLEGNKRELFRYYKKLAEFNVQYLADYENEAMT